MCRLQYSLPLLASITLSIYLFSLTSNSYQLISVCIRSESVNSLVRPNYNNIADDSLSTFSKTKTISENDENIILSSDRIVMKNILYWNSFFSFKDYNFGKGRQPFIDAKCPVNNCYITGERNDNTRVEEFDAIVFHGWRLRKTDSFVPAKRNPFQRYVLFLLEAPGVHGSRLEEFSDFFNWTMTYRLDSDIPIPYGYFVPSNSNRSIGVTESLDIPWKEFMYQEEYLSRFIKTTREKQGMVAWLVSKCKTPSQREGYVKELSKYIKVDIYGECGTLECFGKQSSGCYEMIEKKYRFYLSFENSLCKDYVTEKTFNLMNYTIVPVVYGGARYDKVVPPKSVINTKDFYSPKHLAEYLIYLSEHDEEYVKYFWWKSEYVIQRSRKHYFCKLCEKLNSKTPVKTYNDIESWYEGHEVCHTFKEHFRNVQSSDIV